MPTTPIIERRCIQCGRHTSRCAKCGHRSYCEFCNSCNIHGQEEATPEQIAPPRRQPRGRLFVAQVSFLIRRGWTDNYTVRVHSQGIAGATWHAVRDARRAHLAPRARVQQVRVSLIRA